MRVWCFTLAIIAIAYSQLPAFAQNKDAAKAAAMQAEVMKKIMAKFDLNGDGNVDDEEKSKVVDQFTKDIEAGEIPDGFNALDRNKNGKLDAAEAAPFQAILNRLQGGGQPPFGAGGRGGDGGGAFGGKGGDGGGPFGGRGGDGGAFSGPVSPEILKKFDKNKNGQLDEAEKKAAMAAMGPKRSRNERLQEKLDLNGDGKITKEEREQVAAQRKAELEEKKAEAEEKKGKSKKSDKDKEKDKDNDDKEEKADKDEK